MLSLNGRISFTEITCGYCVKVTWLILGFKSDIVTVGEMAVAETITPKAMFDIFVLAIIN